MQAEFYVRKSLVNHESPIQQPPAIYEELYGRRYFDCAPMRCKLSVESCADNHRRGLCLPCLECPAGRSHAQTIGDAQRRAVGSTDDTKGLRDCIGRPCVRCGNHHNGRMMAASFCARCWNRALEVIAGRNRKGHWPAITAQKLRRVEALIEAEPEQLAAFLATKFAQTKVMRWTAVDAGGVLLEAVMASRGELQAVLDRILPSASIADYSETAFTPPQT